MKEQQYIEAYEKRGALWIHDKNPKRPHALLTSGKHSDGFFNSTPVIQEPTLLRSACNDLAQGIPGLLMDLGHKTVRCHTGIPYLADLDVRWVFGSAMGAINISYEIASQQGCLAGFTEPITDDSGKRMINKRFKTLGKGDKVLVVEDVMTTGGTTLKTISALEEAGAEVLPMVGVLVNRSGMKELKGRKIVALIDREMPMWQPEDCPLCKQGSEAIRPKGNWDKLTAEY